MMPSPPGARSFSDLFSVLLLTPEALALLNQKFAAMVNLGKEAAWDEKLAKSADIGVKYPSEYPFLRFYGLSPDSRFVKSKPSKVGQWLFELCVTMHHTQKPYLAGSWTYPKGSTPSDAIKELLTFLESLNESPLLIMDSYYINAKTRETFVTKNVLYMASVGQNRLNNIFEQFPAPV